MLEALLQQHLRASIPGKNEHPGVLFCSAVGYDLPLLHAGSLRRLVTPVPQEGAVHVDVVTRMWGHKVSIWVQEPLWQLCFPCIKCCLKEVQCPDHSAGID